MTLSRAAIAFCLLCTGASAAPVITEFDVPVHGAHIYPQAINATGEIVGYYNWRRYLRSFTRASDGTIATFEIAQFTVITGLNDKGTVTGYYASQSDPSRGFARDANGDNDFFDVLGAVSTTPRAISNRNHIAGWFQTTAGYARGFLRSPKGAIKTFDAPGAGAGTQQGTYPLAISPREAITGTVLGPDYVYHGFIRSTRRSITTFTVFNAPCAGTAQYSGTIANTINAGGAVAGICTGDDQVTHAFVRASDDTYSVLDMDCIETSTVAINTRGTVGGYCQGPDKVYRSFLRDPDGTIRVFSAPDAGNGEFQGTIATAMNERGDVAGYYFDANGRQHGFVRMR